MVVSVVKQCREAGVDYIIAPLESDAQLTYLQKIGLVDYIISEDSDLLVFGNTKVFYKFNFDNNEGEVFELNKILTRKKFEGFTHKMFQMMCMLSVCDYLPSVKKIGMHKAYQLVKEHKLVARIIEVITSKGLRYPSITCKVSLGVLTVFFTKVFIIL